MNKVTRYVQSYLLLGLPLVIISINWTNRDSGSTLLNALQEILNWNLMFWFLTLTLFLIFLVLAPKARELTLLRLANIKERDEREEIITGKAARVTYISTLSLLIFLFFSSIFSVYLVKLPDTKTIHGKHHALGLGLDYHLFEQPKVQQDLETKYLFNSKMFAFSKSTILIILIFWQLIIFNWVARREQIKSIT